MIADSELILNADGSIYHLNLLPEDLASTIIFVGDPDRVGEVSKYFDRIDVKKGKREFITHTGVLGHKRISVISTGIGTDNIDIVFNEIDALVNIDFETRTLKEELTSLDIIRIGTSGSIQGDVKMGVILASEFAIGFDTLMQYYVKSYSAEELVIQEAIEKTFDTLSFTPYVGRASEKLLARIASDLPRGMTMTAPGFYGPQGRSVRSMNVYPDLIQRASSFDVGGRTITNLEMETAGIYALANMFGHHALSINAILASRVNDAFAANPKEIIDKAIRHVLERL
ncbi:uridine phosphorylase [Sphingobacterium allocomposti]|jgi:uridine phosphorylase|uniref:Uridine phosphorylase n=1 Tax=Sphingobacterium allocomposti TaxID=415956 RepID=A0A5S5DMV1_9SPHI|nr:nucleoside phosphorylase [Sphingobacterium composti Yoo et al. 2007 non Ten et al. 2007]TYP97191.1 uridine phosphorylase [Sphingobacterium composti Yoo et al. 2007 non Ten et al. 2007]HLS96104.1 nucleoside phosphorylase [Sphingobacterium sp.]